LVLNQKSVEAQEYYHRRITLLQKQLKQVQKKFQWYSFFRLILFLLAGNSVFFLWGSIFMAPFFFSFVVLFLLAVHLSVDAKYNRDKTLELIALNNHELKVLDGDWSMFEDGSEMRDAKHPFSLDMDIFGKKSVFQLLNRTGSSSGKRKLASTLLEGAEKVETNSACILELANQMDWCQEFQVEGLINRKEKEKEATLSQLSTVKVQRTKWMRFLRFLLPVLAISSTILFAWNLLSGVGFAGVFVLIMMPTGKYAKKTNAVAQLLSRQSGRVKTVLKQLELYRELSPAHPLFQEEQESLLKEGSGVITEMVELQKILGRFDYRLNLVVAVFLNFFVAWDFLILEQLNKWLQKNAGEIEEWEEKLALMEVWISGAVFKFNRPDSTFASISEENRSIDIKGLAHPFVEAASCVLNSVEISERENFIIITGPNMAGKSTYLRSLGLAFVCANAGFPVLAQSCALPKLKLFSSMRTSDDLTEESSYFHAELIRLRMIMDAIEREEKVFVILDEILKGTNSKDKEIGSAKFLQKLKRMNAKGIIATHDLSLCELAKGDPAFHNMCFDSVIEGENLSFDYKINDGVCKNMNASFLLRKMCLVDED
jgi:hypothetical protein